MRRIAIIAVVVLAVAGAGFLGLRHLGRQAQKLVASAQQTAEVRRGLLVARVDAAGAVESPSTVSLAFQASGQVASVSVAEGEQVKAGQAIACLDAVEAELQVAQAEASLVIAQARLEQTKKATAAEDVAAARASLASARENLNRLQAGPTAEDLEIARLRWEQAKDQLWGAQSQRDATCGSHMASSATCDQTRAAVASAEMAAEIARIQYEQAKQGTGQAELRAAEAQVAQAQANLASLLQGAAAEDLRVAQAQVTQAEVTLRQARHQLDQMCLRAPFDGTVTRLSLRVGQIAGPATVVGELADLGAGDDGALRLMADMPEVDVAKVRAGQEAEITLDALPGRSFKGHVAAVASTGTSIQGVVNYPVTIGIDEPEPAIRPGMTANASIVVERREDALLVPNRAIRVQDGKYYVHLLPAGSAQPTNTEVQIGLSDDVSTEVLGDALKEGDVLLLNPPPNMLRQMSGRPSGGVMVEP